MHFWRYTLVLLAVVIVLAQRYRAFWASPGVAAYLGARPIVLSATGLLLLGESLVFTFAPHPDAWEMWAGGAMFGFGLWYFIGAWRPKIFWTGAVDAV